MRWRDRAFQSVFSKLFVYNILFEDAEVDESILTINERSRVLSISGAGCGVAGMVSRRPRSIDAVDINKHHLALTALKVAAAQCLTSYRHFYALLGHGSVRDPMATIRRLSTRLPHWATTYWQKHADRFADNFYEEGLTANILARLRRLVGFDADYMRELVGQTPEERLRTIENTIRPVLERPWVNALINSPVQLLSLGINYEQRQKLLDAEGQADMAGLILHHLRRLATTDLETNWFAWLHVAGHYNHEREDAVPPYLRRDRWERSVRAPTTTRYHNRNLLDVLEAADDGTWTHYSLCDMPDWLAPKLQRHMLDEIYRTSEDGALVLYRTVEDDCIVGRHGMHRQFERKSHISERATRMDRSRQYKHVHLYQVEKATA
jgi:S-adenosylmethionine-diacylglycerol 3-amino-3-carboxypropyl transferase